MDDNFFAGQLSVVTAICEKLIAERDAIAEVLSDAGIPTGCEKGIYTLEQRVKMLASDQKQDEKYRAIYKKRSDELEQELNNLKNKP